MTLPATNKIKLEPAFEVVATPAIGMIRIKIIGFWDNATIDRFADEVVLAMNTLVTAGIRPGDFLFMSDIRRSAIQSPHIVERFEGLVDMVGSQARRVAVLSAGVLQKMQMQRTAKSYDQYRFYLAEEEAAAEAWLLKGDTA